MSVCRGGRRCGAPVGLAGERRDEGGGQPHLVIWHGQLGLQRAAGEGGSGGVDDRVRIHLVCASVRHERRGWRRGRQDCIGRDHLHVDTAAPIALVEDRDRAVGGLAHSKILEGQRARDHSLIARIHVRARVLRSRAILRARAASQLGRSLRQAQRQGQLNVSRYGCSSHPPPPPIPGPLPP